MNDKPQPIEAFKFGNFDFAMWNNQGEDLRIFQSVSIKRTYMDGNGNWQDGGEIRLLPQQLNDLALGAQDMFRFWRLGMRQRRQQATRPESHAQNSNAEQSAEQKPEPAQTSELPTESPVGQKSSESIDNAEQGELSGVGTGEQSFRENVTRSRGSKRSR